LFLYVFTICFFLTSKNTSAQTIEIKYVEFAANQVVLHYDLVDSVADRFFTIRLYSSKDNFLNPLEKITGDVGFEIGPGPNKKIVWNAKEEFGDQFDGKISLLLRGRIFVPFIKLDQINQYKVFKRLRKYDLTWGGGTPQNILNFDLYNGDQKIMTFPNLANVGHHQFRFPAHVKPGKNYRFKVSDTKNKEGVVFTKSFQIKRKVPLLIMAVPIAAIVTTIVLLRDEEIEKVDHAPRP